MAKVEVALSPTELAGGVNTASKVLLELLRVVGVGWLRIYVFLRIRGVEEARLKYVEDASTVVEDVPGVFEDVSEDAFGVAEDGGK